MRDHRELFEVIQKRPGMWGLEETYAVHTAFMVGYDQACMGGLLSGFREWLVMRLKMGSNLGWEELVLDVAFPGVGDPRGALRSGPEAERVAIDTLFALLKEFDEVRMQRDGLGKVFSDYEKYLNRRRINR